MRGLSLSAGRQIPLVMLGLALTGAILAALIFRPQQPAAPASAPPRPPLLVAARPIAAGALIAADDLRLAPAKNQRPGSIISESDAVGHVAARAFAAGEPLVRTGLRDAAQAGIAARVPPGNRAFAIRVSEDDIVGGFLQSGHRVDIIAVIPGTVFPSANTQPDRSRAVLLLQNVPVLSVGEQMEAQGAVQPAARTIALSLDPQQVARLALAQRYGKISVAIRNPGDDATGLAAEAGLQDIVARGSAPEQQTSHPHPVSQAIPFLSGLREASLTRSRRR